MRPAWSVIFFTTMAGAGYGLLCWQAAVLLAAVPGGDAEWVAIGVGAALVSAGLLSSTFHLGRPGRAWRALSQWRTSWLSREGVVALASYLPMAWLAWSLHQGQTSMAAAALILLLAFATVFCTAMIYASLKTVAAWHHFSVPLIYLLFAGATGGYVLLLIRTAAGGVNSRLVQAVAATLIVAWLTKLIYWRGLASAKGSSSVASATGLTGQVRPLDPPHTADNYLMREMVFEVGRRHAGKLRGWALLLGLGVPLLAALGVLRLAAPWSLAAAVVGLISLLVGTFIERWLFFAQARHTVSLYYGANQA